MRKKLLQCGKYLELFFRSLLSWARVYPLQMPHFTILNFAVLSTKDLHPKYYGPEYSGEQSNRKFNTPTWDCLIRYIWIFCGGYWFTPIHDLCSKSQLLLPAYESRFSNSAVCASYSKWKGTELESRCFMTYTSDPWELPDNIYLYFCIVVFTLNGVIHIFKKLHKHAHTP